MKPSFKTSLQVKSLNGPWWEVMKPLRYKSAVLDREVVVPVGFVTDFDSIRKLPPLLFWFFTVDEDRPPVIHDYLYRMAKDERKLCDQTYLEAMTVESYPAYKRYPKYYGVRWGGSSAYGKHKKNLDPREKGNA